MFDIHNYSSFIMAILVFQALPGAGTVIILNAAARDGVLTGAHAVLGTLTGDFLYMLAAVLGLAAVFSAYPGILQGLQWMGVAYISLVGLQQIFTSKTVGSSKKSERSENLSYFRQGMIVSLTNPKVMLFFMAFFPLYLNDNSTPSTLVILMMHVVIISFVFQSGLVIIGNGVAKWFSRWRVARHIARKLAGITLISFGIQLALT